MSTSEHNVIENNCQYKMLNINRQDRLEAELSYHTHDRLTMKPNGSGPLYFLPVNSVPMLFQLATRSICRSNRCVPPDMDTHEGICQPTLELGGQDSISSADTTGQLCTGSSRVEVATMVPYSAIMLIYYPHLIHLTIK